MRSNKQKPKNYLRDRYTNKINWSDNVGYYSKNWFGGSFGYDVNVMELARVKKIISNYVHILTGKTIPIIYKKSSDSSTDGQCIVISADIKNIDKLIGTALHEAAHIVKTDFSIPMELYLDINDELLDKYYNPSKHWFVDKIVRNTLFCIANIIEDHRINNWIFETSPGYYGYLNVVWDDDLYSKESTLKLISNERRDLTWHSYIYRIYMLLNPKSDLNALPKLDVINEMIDYKNIGRLKNTGQVIKLATDIFNIIEPIVELPLKVIGLPDGVNYTPHLIFGTVNEVGQYNFTVKTFDKEYNYILNINEPVDILLEQLLMN